MFGAKRNLKTEEQNNFTDKQKVKLVVHFTPVATYAYICEGRVGFVENIYSHVVIGDYGANYIELHGNFLIMALSSIEEAEEILKTLYLDRSSNNTVPLVKYRVIIDNNGAVNIDNLS